MELKKIYNYLDLKYSPLIRYFAILPYDEIPEFIEMIVNNTGCMREFYGFEIESDKTITFYDFSSEKEKSINLNVKDIINILNPMIEDYLHDNPLRKREFELNLLKIQ